ncbi:hypothetical protein F5I97DRAFT_1844874 [Phlebopus sp. FC_14]|nr:hypothetical protein F5I97DRAFT_1844874 [Phlebopus sp. FC_14]
MAQDQVALATRFSVPSGHIGTIKYVGQVNGTHGLWYGVEWDDPNRGKHDGMKDGHRYFNCRVSNAGSFIRPSASLSFGRSFLTALSEKYIETIHGPATKEMIMLGSSNGAIKVEAVGLDRIRSNLSTLDRLREVSLDSERVATGDNSDEIHETCPNIRGLDLSGNLLSTWNAIASLTAGLPHLQRLALNRNRLLPFDIEISQSAFQQLVELQLNKTLITWEEFSRVSQCMTRLKIVELGHNRLESLVADSSSIIPTIQSFNFDSNQLSDWTQISESMSKCVRLHRLVLSSNNIRTIPPSTSRHSPLEGVTNLGLPGNKLGDWKDIDNLSQWCPNLESLSIVGNPIAEENDLACYARQFAVAKIPSLLVLDSAPISQRERTDCELFYLSFISKNVPGNCQEKAQHHPQWNALCNKHGRPEESLMTNGNDILKNSLIGETGFAPTVEILKNS